MQPARRRAQHQAGRGVLGGRIDALGERKARDVQRSAREVSSCRLRERSDALDLEGTE
jgi:hypothetical protein